MKVIIFGGSGHVGQALTRLWCNTKEIKVISRHGGDERWDGKSVGAWAEHLEGADVVINLAGRSVNCRYDEANLREMMDSRTDSVRVIGGAIRSAKHPPRIWLQASTATIYAHRFDAPNDEHTGVLGGTEPGAPTSWNASIEIARAWEREFFSLETPGTRRVALRSAMTMSPIPGSVFGVLAELARDGLGGRQGSGKHYVSWVHEVDFVRALDFLIERDDVCGAVNICSPNPLPQAEFAADLREALGVWFAPPLPVWALELGAWLRGTETELILKSRRVVPTRLLEMGFQFRYSHWKNAAIDLVRKLEALG